MATIDVGKIKFTWRSAFSTSNTYEKDDVVSYQGSSWVYVNAASKTGSAAGAPSTSNSSHWDLMADGTNPLTTSGDIMTHNGSAATRLPIGNQGQYLKVTSSNAVSYANQTGWDDADVLDSNVPLYAKTHATTHYGTDGKYPWLAQYNGKSGASADWIPYDGFVNPPCGPVKHARTDLVSTHTCFPFINSNHEIMLSGYAQYGFTGYSNGSYHAHLMHVMNLSTEFGSMEIGEYFTRIWFNQHSLMALTNKGNVFCQGENGSGQLGLGDTTDRYQLVKNPYLGADSTNNGISMEVAAITTNDAGGYQAMGNTCYWAITHDGRLFQWGWNGNSIGGHGDTTNRNKPTLVQGVSNVKHVSPGYNNCWVIDGSGNIFFTGANTHGVSGGVNAARTTFAQDTSITNVAQIANASSYYYNGGIIGGAYLIRDNGDLHHAGYNGNNQGATGNTTNNTNIWRQMDSGNNYAAVHVVGHGSTYAMMAMLGKSIAQNGPGDAYTYCVNAGNAAGGLPIRTAGYNAHGFRMQGNTTSTNTVTQPAADSMANYNHKSVSSADGTLSETNEPFPRDNIKAIFPMKTSGYQTNMVWMLDIKNRLWMSGVMGGSAYEYHAATGTSATFTKAFLWPARWNHTDPGNGSSATTQFHNGFDPVKAPELKIIDIKSAGHYYSGYWTHWARMEDGQLWMIGNNYYYQHGQRANHAHHHWHRRTPG